MIKTTYTAQQGGLAVSAALPLAQANIPTVNANNEMRQAAHAAASILTNALADLGAEIRISRDHITGQRLDNRKRRAIGVALRNGNVNPYELRPYIRRDSEPSFPSIGIAASAGLSECIRHVEVNEDLGSITIPLSDMPQNGNTIKERDGDWMVTHKFIPHEDSATKHSTRRKIVRDTTTYIRKISAITLAIQWALETVSTPVYSALCEGFTERSLSPKQPYSAAQLGYILAHPDWHTPLSTYGLLQDAEILYSRGFWHFHRKTEFGALAQQLQGTKNRNDAIFPSRNGGNAVHWMRQTYNPDIVISIGNNNDRTTADIDLDILDIPITNLMSHVAATIRKRINP